MRAVKTTEHNAYQIHYHFVTPVKYRKAVYGGEFTFCHPFTSFDGEIQAFGQKLYRYQFYIMSGTDNGAALSFPLFVSEKALKGYKPEIGDALTGSGWLQGYLADSLRD